MVGEVQSRYRKVEEKTRHVWTTQLNQDTNYTMRKIDEDGRREAGRYGNVAVTQSEASTLEGRRWMM